MRAAHIEDLVRQARFRPFDIHIDSRIVSVKHPEQMYLTPDKSILVVVTEDNHLQLLDTDRISSISMRSGGRQKKSS